MVPDVCNFIITALTALDRAPLAYLESNSSTDRRSDRSIT